MSLNFYKEQCPEDRGALKIVLFKSNGKLRGHAIKHMVKKFKQEIIWREFLQYIKEDDIEKCKQDLHALNCPGFIYNMDEFPCESKTSGVLGGFSRDWCNFYEECTELKSVKIVENEYLRIVFEFIKESMNIPRYACCLGKNKNGSKLWTVPNKNFVVIADLLTNDRVYNLSSCYPPENTFTWQQARDYAKRRMWKECSSKPIWCIYDNWKKDLTPLKSAYQKALNEAKKSVE
jgi:hypothetical protein